jgi:hypothetical protein
MLRTCDFVPFVGFNSQEVQTEAQKLLKAGEGPGDMQGRVKRKGFSGKGSETVGVRKC